VLLWAMNGFNIAAQQPLGTVSTSWHIAAQAPATTPTQQQPAA
jgi:hypothetical protein